jgi:methionyl-tRNA formyltransferase
MKIVFMGTSRASATSLHRLLADGHKVVAVYTQPDRPAGRGKKVTFSPVKQLALADRLLVFQPTKIRTPDALETFRSHAADIAVVVAYGRILPQGFLTAFRYGAVNVHFSLLPKYRGAAPVNWAIVNGETETGVTTMKMDAGLDTGDILLQRATPIRHGENAVELMERLAALGADLLAETLSDIEQIRPIRQNDAKASFAPLLSKTDGNIDWTMPAVEIERRVRGFQPFPTAYTFYRGRRLTIWKAATLDPGPHGPMAGTVTEAHADRLAILCGQNSLLLVDELQPEGKRRMSVRDFLNGAQISVGDRLGQFGSTAESRASSKIS